VTDRDAATMFAWNLPAVRRAQEVAPEWMPAPAELDALQQELDDLAHMAVPTSRIRWGLRQVALRLTDS
jgi:hypothetical protein